MSKDDSIAQAILEDVDEMLQSSINEYQETETQLVAIAAKRDALYRLRAKVQQRIAEAKKGE